MPEDNYQYSVRCYYQHALGLNYNIATTKCTLWPVATNNPEDCRISYYYGNYAMVLTIYRAYESSGRTLGASGSGNGAQLYWYFNPTAEENWNISAW